MKLTISIALVLALALGATATGAAKPKPAFKTGSYMGTTSQERLILFKVTKKRVKHISSGFTADCGLNSETSGHEGKISRKGRFTATTDLGGSRTVIKGRVKGRSASGTMRFKSGPCDTGQIKWEARRER